MNREGTIFSICYGTQGHILIAPDYLGYGVSQAVHPYVHARSEAIVAEDLLVAAQAASAKLNLTLNKKLFLTGYSQGGHATLSLHRHLQAGGKVAVTASTPMAGPYAPSIYFNHLVTHIQSQTSDPSSHTRVEVSYLLWSWSQIYPKFPNKETIFIEPYLSGIDKMFDGSSTWGQVMNYFDKDLHGLLKKDFVDDLSQPDHVVYLAAKDNDVYQWVPTSPVRFLHGSIDKEVEVMHSQVAYKYMKEQGAKVELELIPNQNHQGAVPSAISSSVNWFNQF